MSNFEKTLRATQAQWKAEEKKYKETGLKTELMLRMEALAKANKWESN